MQGISLVLWAYQRWRYHPEGTTLAALSSAIRQRVMSFKPSELAGAMEAFSALGFHPGNDVIQARLFTGFASLVSVHMPVLGV